MSKNEEKGSGIPAAIKTALPAEYDYGDDVGGGFENTSADDFAVPFVEVLQPQSPEVIRSNGSVKAGSWMNKTTGEIWEAAEKGVLFVPAITDHCYTKWIPKNPDGTGGGFVGRLELTDPLVQKARIEAPFKKYRTPDNFDLAETYYVYGETVEEDGATAPAILAFGSTKIKSYKSWMNRARSLQVLSGGRRVNPPLFSHVYRLKTVMRTRGQQTWYVPDIDFRVAGNAEQSRLAPTDRFYLEARAIRDAFQKGEVKADLSKTDNSVASEDEDGPKGRAPF